MSDPLSPSALLTYFLQAALLLALSLPLPALLRLHHPGLRLRFWQALLAACLLLPLLQPLARPISGGLALATDAGLTTAVAASMPEAAHDLPFGLLSGIVLLGIVFFLARLLLGMLALARLRRQSTSFAAPADLATLQRSLDIRAELRVGQAASVPLTFGWRRPVVLLPPDFPDLPEKMQRGILCHELLHVQRGDWLTALGEELLRSLLWFHPAVWLLLARIQLCREQLVDRQVVQLLGERRAYLEALGAIAMGRPRSGLRPATTFIKRSHLLARVALLTKGVSMSRFRQALNGSLLAVALLAVTTLVTLLFPTAHATADERILYVEGDVLAPKRIHSVIPEYTEQARKERVQGAVKIQAIIDEGGRIIQTSLLKSLDPGLDQAAIEAVEQWRFSPALLDEVPVKVYYNLTINFRLDAGEKTSDGEKPPEG